MEAPDQETLAARLAKMRVRSERITLVEIKGQRGESNDA